MKLILLGAPGAGKGTQAEMICDRLSIPAVSTGNILREAVKNETELGKNAKSYMDAGKLVPDDVIIGMLKERLAQDDCKNGFILDGFPRTVPQAEALEQMGVILDKVIEIHVPDEVITERISGRRVCADCSSSYHIEYKPSKKTDVCDRCSGTTVLRKDDEPATVKERLRVYHEQTSPLKRYYDDKKILHTVIGQLEVADTTALTIKVLEA